MFVYTDGVPEATNAAEEMFGAERLVDVLNQRGGAEPEELIRHVHNEVDQFVGDAPQFDDVTMLCFKYRGPHGQETMTPENSADAASE